MTARDLVGVMQQVLWTTLIVGGPIVIAGLVVGLIVSFFQAATQMKRAIPTSMSSAIVIAAVLVVLGPSMVGSLMDLTRYVFNFAVSAGPAVGG